jgi:N-acyl-D-aspartate/D-glutamate deacylase
MSSLAPWVLLVVLGPGAAPAEKVEADVVLRGGTICDGRGGAPFVGDVALRKDRIVAVGRFTLANRPREIDARGLVVAPGFIDLHTHSDYPLQRPPTRANLNYLYQGVTTVVTGNCGSGPHDVAAYYRALEKGKVGSNVLHLVPHGAVRRAVLKSSNRPPSKAELAQLEALVEQGMRDGAWGMSTGLIYVPSAYARTDELIALARVVARHGGIYVSHIRDEGVGLLEAIEEALRIGRASGAAVHISHLKASGKRAWGLAADAIALILRARKAGQTVTADQYPYVASSTSLDATLLPARMREGGRKAFVARLRHPETGPILRKAIQRALDARDGGARVRIASYAPRPAWRGKDLAAIAKMEKKTALEIVLEIEANGGAGIVNFGMKEEDVRLIMKQPFVATASDGGSMVPSKTTVPHPRAYGTFPHKIGHYALDEKVVSLEQAIRSASGLPADVLGLRDRGYLKVGQFADVVVFDPKAFRARSTYDNPHRYAAGLRYLFVNGTAAIAEGKPTGALAGRVLRNPGRAK